VKVADIRQSFTDPKFRHGGYAALITAIVLAILVVLNIVADQTALKWDLSEHRWFTLSPQTQAALERLRKPVTIYRLGTAGGGDPLVKELLQRYRDRCRFITVRAVDPDRNPGFVEQFRGDGGDLTAGSLIVSAGARYKTIRAEDLFHYDDSVPGRRQVTSLALEQRVTGALLYLDRARNPVIYTLSGHQEEPLDDDILRQLEAENYTVKELSLFTRSIPGDADILMVVSPKRDLTAAEAAKLRDFLAGGGRAALLIDLTRSDYPNLGSVLAGYGVAVRRLMVVEDDSSFNAGNPIFLLPRLAAHPIVAALREQKMPVLIPASQAIQTLEVKKRTVTVEPLLTTSAKAWGQTRFGDAALQRSDAAPAGPFTLAAAVSDSPGAGRSRAAKLVLMGSALFLNPQFSGSVPGNTSLLTNSLNWLSDQQGGLSIQPKSLLSLRLNMNGFQALICAGIAVILIPLAVLAAGVTVWLRRRHR
jgi:ABC-type uncharacterized transport system involved in gliding motility auxiliary subunit